jgi:hypothetical protein
MTHRNSHFAHLVVGLAHLPDDAGVGLRNQLAGQVIAECLAVPGAMVDDRVVVAGREHDDEVSADLLVALEEISQREPLDLRQGLPFYV